MLKSRSEVRDMVAGFRTNTDAEKAAFIDGWNMADKNPGWIDSRIAVPEKDGRYLAFDGEFIDIRKFDADEGIWSDEHYILTDPPRLWMPLPEIPIPSTAD